MLVRAGIGVCLMAGVVAGVMWFNRGSHVVVEGKIQKVRIQEVDTNSSIVVVDFRFTNPADYPFVVRSVALLMEEKDGKTVEGVTVAEIDARRVFTYYPALGQKFNDTLVIREKIAPKQTLDRMLAAQFNLTEAKLNERARLRLRVEDVDGVVSEIRE
jgi:hypothetical protein